MCTVAAIIYFLGYMPPRDTVITIPKARVAELSAKQQRVARSCAARYGIKWRIEE